MEGSGRGLLAYLPISGGEGWRGRVRGGTGEVGYSRGVGRGDRNNMYTRATGEYHISHTNLTLTTV